MPAHFKRPVETEELPRPLASHCKECTTKTLSAEQGAPTSCVPKKATPYHFAPRGVAADAIAMNPKLGTSGPKAMPQTTVTSEINLAGTDPAYRHTDIFEIIAFVDFRLSTRVERFKPVWWQVLIQWY